ncbi:Ribose import permease protein RbsC [Microbacterium lemovicicum]|uniref:Ribose import permease protein RbsC n=1 Tax=Microbacterium lemovicicum TaxID=1072463 RepID=A0A3S9WCV3_9MICO|nr:ABC transporter permease [Microbacterium lemovicicum]AZS37864.1 Ribose import permease protein RbsC [Microbacterium lemovicicum]
MTTAPKEGTHVTTTSSTAVQTGAMEVERPSLPKRIVSVVGVQNISLIIAIALVVAIIGIQNPLFFGVANLRVIGTAITIMGLLAVVQTIVIILGALDISVGSIAGLTSVTSAMIFTAAGTAAGVAGAIAIGVLCGLINGCIIVFGRVNPVIATLATLAAFMGAAQLISDGRAQGYTGADPFFVFLARGAIIGVPVLIWVLVIVAALAYVVLRFTSIGRNIYAVGGNNIASRLAGININRYVIGTYMITGAVAAIAGILITARTGSGQPVSGSEGLELQAITAAALGGAALKGGKGTIVGTLLAVILLGVLTNGMTLLGVNSFWQNVAQGALLVIAVVIQQLRSGERRIGIPG